MIRYSRNIILLIVAIFSVMTEVAAQSSGSSAVVVVYHRFGEEHYPSTNIRTEQFERHIALLSNKKFHVMRLEDIASAIRKGETLPDRTVGITIDDAYYSAYAKAWPMLREANLPFTLFVNTNAVDQGHTGMMNWSQIKEMKDAGVTIGNHSASHSHLMEKNFSEWKNEIRAAQKRIVEILGVESSIYAYPYGEASKEIASFLREEGFTAAFGQHSGVASEWLDPFYLPRFSFNEKYGDIARFALAINSLPLPIKEITPSKMILANNPPIFGFTMAWDTLNTEKLQCFSSGQRVAGQIEKLGKSRIEVRFEKPFKNGRGRINCTLPTERNRWRWLGMQYLVP